MLRKTIIKIYILFAIIISFNFIHAASYEWNIGGLKQMDYDSIEGEEIEVELTFYCGVNNAMEGGALSAAGRPLVYGNLANNYYTGMKSENGGKSWTKLDNGYSLGTNVYIKDVGLFSIEDRGGSSDFNQTNRMDLFVARKEGESDSDWEKRTNSYGRIKVKAKVVKVGTERIWEWPSGNGTASSVSNSNVVSGKNTGINTKVIYNNLRVVTKTGEKPAPLTSNCKDAVELYWNKTTTLSGEGSTEAGFSGSIVGSTFMQGEENTVTTFAGTFPKYRQTSQYEWSKWPYADETIADEGCGPTSLAIILSGLGLVIPGYDGATLKGHSSPKDGFMTPPEVCAYSLAVGGCQSGGSMYHSFPGKVMSALGIECIEFSGKGYADEVLELLKQGYCGVASSSTGYFTNSGHIIAVVGANPDDGGNTIGIVDPNGGYGKIRDGFYTVDQLNGDALMPEKNAMSGRNANIKKWWIFKYKKAE